MKELPQKQGNWHGGAHGGHPCKQASADRVRVLEESMELIASWRSIRTSHLRLLQDNNHLTVSLSALNCGLNLAHLDRNRD